MDIKEIIIKEEHIVAGSRIRDGIIIPALIPMQALWPVGLVDNRLFCWTTRVRKMQAARDYVAQYPHSRAWGVDWDFNRSQETGRPEVFRDYFGLYNQLTDLPDELKQRLEALNV